MYCTYLTIYRGNRMPPFYIGRTKLSKISKGYRGSVSSKKYRETWESETLESPHLFETIVLSTHVTANESAEREEKLHQALRVHINPLYINMATSSGKFITKHTGEENFWYGKNRSAENNPMYGKKHTAATKEKMRKNGAGKNKGIPKSAAHVEAVRRALVGRTYVELHGDEKAAALKKALSGERTPEHATNLKKALKLAHSIPRKCPHCEKEVRGAGNYSRWHGVKCKFFQSVHESTITGPVPKGH